MASFYIQIERLSMSHIPVRFDNLHCEITDQWLEKLVHLLQHILFVCMICNPQLECTYKRCSPVRSGPNVQCLAFKYAVNRRRFTQQFGNGGSGTLW